MTLPTVSYGAILADPPWSYQTWSKKNQRKAAERYYSVMDLDAIKALPVRDIAADDCVLFLWVLNSMPHQAHEVINAWGFEYKTVAFTWVKRTTTDRTWHIGLGYWTRQNTERCLLATRGKPKRLSKSVREVIISPRREHSRKPDEVRDSIRNLVGGPYLEMFSRTTAPGWDSWGNEMGLLDTPVRHRSRL